MDLDPLDEAREINPAMTRRERVERLEEAMLSMPQAECPVRHYFAPGVFAREITIPKGVVLIGAVHTTENLAVLSAGVLEIVTDEGTRTIAAPATVTVKPGDKNCAYAAETAVWTNFFPNPDNETDIDVLVERYSESKSCELLGGSQNKQLAANRMAEIEGVPV